MKNARVVSNPVPGVSTGRGAGIKSENGVVKRESERYPFQREVRKHEPGVIKNGLGLRKRGVFGSIRECSINRVW